MSSGQIRKVATGGQSYRSSQGRRASSPFVNEYNEGGRHLDDDLLVSRRIEKKGAPTRKE